MNYLITYVPNIEAFLDELEALAPTYVYIDDEGNRKCNIATTPIVHSGYGTLAMSILTDENVEFIGLMSTIDILGTYEEIWADEEKHNLYRLVYPYDVPIAAVDADGNPTEYYRPKKIGEFAI